MPMTHHEYHPERKVVAPHHILPKELKGFLEGGLSAVVAGVSTHPLDLIKVRMQLVGEGTAARATASAAAFSYSRLSLAGSHVAPRKPFAAASAPPAAAAAARPGALEVTSQIIRSQGVAGLFSGVSATALRQVLYSSSRMGIYEMTKSSLEKHQIQVMEARGQAVTGGHVSIPVAEKVAAAMVAGAMGAAIGNPAELAMVRMQADGRLPAELRRNYKGVGDALGRIVREEGTLSLWRGCGPTIYRAMAVTAGQLAAYDEAKEFILERRLLPEGMASHVAAAFTAAIVASLVSNPFDVIKTRLMNMTRDPVTGMPPYRSAVDCAVKTVQAEGPLALYKGLLPTIARQGPFALILFVTLEQVRLLFRDF